VIHFILTLCYCIFFVIHVVQVILAGWNNFRAMVAGFDIVNDPPASAILVAPSQSAPVPSPATALGPPPVSPSTPEKTSTDEK
jgi:hypothetical protein